MARTKLGRLAYWTMLVLLAVAFATVEKPVSGADGKTPVKKILGRKGRRLPSYYGSVVNEKQREEIYAIQEEYQPKIEALQNQLSAMKKERDEKISAVLTAEQKKQVEEAAAKAKHKPKDVQPAKPAKEVPATPSADPPPA